MSYRIKPQDITPTTSSPFMTVHAARVLAPLSELLGDPELFLNVRNNLRPGDRVDLCRYDSGDWTGARVIEYVTVLITQKTTAAVEFRSITEVFDIDAAKPDPAAGKPGGEPEELEVVDDPQGGHLVRGATSKHVHKHFKTKAAAERYVVDYGKPKMEAA